MNKYVEYRREFHKYPENGWREIRTSARIAEILTGMGYTCFMGEEVVNVDTIISLVRPDEAEVAMLKEQAIRQGANPKFVEATGGIPGVIAEYDTGKKGPVTAFRFDIDCLPYDEPQTEGYRPYDEGFASVNPGAVHACGHDAHTAMGLGIADKLMMQKDRIRFGKIRLIFQPAEETFCGALSICDKGWLDDVDNFIAMHVALSAENKPLPSHTICCGCKDFLSDRQLDVTFHGRAAHPCGASQEGKNALLAACTAAINLHAIAPHEEGMHRINVGKIEAGVAPNTIAPNALMVVEYRGVTENITEYVGRRVFDIIEGAARMYDMDYTVEDYGEVPAGKSDDSMMDVIRRASVKVPWIQKMYFEGNVGGTDDAAAMITRVQKHGGRGTYVGIGCDTTEPVHNAGFDLDEDCIEAAVDLCMNALESIHG
ncbi:MAG: amidohydrolase [Firmicutes bacterium]|nr:amidohydrolase [Bacillota bacterium]